MLDHNIIKIKYSRLIYKIVTHFNIIIWYFDINIYWMIKEYYILNVCIISVESLNWLPEVGVLKFNIDGAFRGFNMPAGIGNVVRDWEGKVIDGFHDTIFSCSPLWVEACALLRACSMAGSLDARHVIFESDCKVLVDAINTKSEGVDWRCDALIGDISAIVRSKSNWKVTWIPRLANLAADWVAKEAAKKMCHLGWVCTPPSSFASIVSRDLLLCSKREPMKFFTLRIV